MSAPRLRKLSPEALRAAVPAELRERVQWVVHRNKVPSHPVTRRLARVNDPSTWGRFEEALDYYRETFADLECGIGYVFTDADGIVAIDFDHIVRNGAWLPGSEPVQELLDLLGGHGYAEVSPSGTGAHVFIKGKLPVNANHKRVLDAATGMKVEAWDRARYVTITGQRRGESGELTENPALLAALADLLGQHDTSDRPAEPPEPERAAEMERALTFLDPDCGYEEWIRIGMALRAGLGAAGRDLWLRWSRGDLHGRRAAKYDPCGANDPQSKWDSFTGSGVGLGTLVRMAKEAGWSGAPHVAPDPDAAFGPYYDPAKEAMKPGDASALGGRRLKDRVQVLDAFQEKPLEWFWKDLVKTDSLAFVGGDPERGKSIVACALAALVTRGLPLPFDPRPRVPQDVIYLTIEEGAEDVLRGRFRVMGADLTRLHVLKTDAEPFSLATEVGELRALIREKRAGMVVLDAWDSIVGAKNDTDKGRVVRALLDPLIVACREEHVVVFIIIHLKKARDAATALQLLAGSVGIGAAARGVLFVGFEDPDAAESEEDQTKLLRVIAPAKQSNSPKRGGLSFRILPSPADPKIPMVEWVGPTKTTAAGAVRRPETGRPARSRDKAAEWLGLRLSSGDEVPARLIFEEGEAAGHNERTLRRAAKDLGATIRALGTDEKGRVRGSVWSLPRRGKGAA